MARNQAGAEQAAPQSTVVKSKGKLVVLISVGLLALLLSAAGLTYALLANGNDKTVD